MATRGQRASQPQAAAGARKAKAPTPAGRPRPAPKAPAPAGRPRSGGGVNNRIGGGGGGSVGGYVAGGPVGGALAPAPSPMSGLSDEDYLSGDASYQAQLAALNAALQNTTADYTAQKTRYEGDYNTGLKNLGWMNDTNGWNREDQNTSSGRAFQNMQNDFASRGLLQSSGFATNTDDLFRNLNDQRGQLGDGRKNFLDDLTRQEAQFKSEDKLSRQSAQAEALARRAAGLTSI